MVFGNRSQREQQQQLLRMMNGFTPTFSAFSGESYDSDVVRSAIDAIARNGAKLKAKHIRNGPNGIENGKSNLERLLSVRPNQYMSAYDFYYKIITLLYTQNNAFVFIDWDEAGTNVKALYPVPASTVEFLEPKSGTTPNVRFRFYGGQMVVLPYSQLVHLRRFFYRNDLFGETSDKALTPILDLINTTDQGIANAVKSSAFLRGILKFTQMVKPEDMKAQRDMFVSDYLDIANNGGIAATDSKAEYIPLQNDPKMIDSKQMEQIKDKVYSYFGVNEKIIKSNYTEDEWNAFYESSIEPIAIQMSLEFTEKLFTSRERGFGNEIVFESNRLQYASLTTKLNLMQMVDRGAMTPNEWREALNLPAIEGGDKPVRRLDTAPVNETDINGGDGGGQDPGTAPEG
jgi:HK97 family phage portal protein